MTADTHVNRLRNESRLRKDIVGGELEKANLSAVANLYSGGTSEHSMELMADISELSGAAKIAILLMKLGKERSSKILRHMRDNEVAAVMSEVARLQNVPPHVVAAVMQEFRLVKAASQHVALGGVDIARDLLEDAVGEDKARDILERLHVSLYNAPFEFLRKADPRQVLGF